MILSLVEILGKLAPDDKLTEGKGAVGTQHGHSPVLAHTATYNWHLIPCVEGGEGEIDAAEEERETTAILHVAETVTGFRADGQRPYRPWVLIVGRQLKKAADRDGNGLETPFLARVAQAQATHRDADGIVVLSEKLGIVHRRDDIRQTKSVSHAPGDNLSTGTHIPMAVGIVGIGLAQLEARAVAQESHQAQSARWSYRRRCPP